MYISIQSDFADGVRIVPESRAEIAALQLLFGANLKVEAPPLAGDVNSRGEPDPATLLYREEIGDPSFLLPASEPSSPASPEVARVGLQLVDAGGRGERVHHAGCSGSFVDE